MAHAALLKIKAGILDALSCVKKHKRYVYILTTHVTGEVDGVHSDPVLGLHSNYTKASKHFDIELKERLQYGEYRLYWNVCDVIHCGNHMEMWKARIEYRSPHGNLVHEEITVARWFM